MQRTIKVQVTAEDIRNGERANAINNPIALAFTRRLKKLIKFRVDYDSINIHDDWLVLRLPPEATTFMFNFDLKREVKPFQFELYFRALKGCSTLDYLDYER